MKKRWNILASALLILPLAASLASAPIAMADDTTTPATETDSQKADETITAPTDTTQATIAIHKLGNISSNASVPAGSAYANTANYPRLAGFSYAIFDITGVSQADIDPNTNIQLTDAATADGIPATFDFDSFEIANGSNTFKANLTKDTFVAGGTTDEDGTFKVDVPKKSGNKNATYVILEAPKEGFSQPNAATVISFPAYEDNSDTELSVINVYPKSDVTASGSLYLQKIGTADNKGINGASFVITRDDGYAVAKTAADAQYTFTNDPAEYQTFVSGNAYFPSTASITEFPLGENSGYVNVSGLPVGTYTITETQSVKDIAALIKSETVKKVKIAVDADDATKVTVQELDADGNPVAKAITINNRLKIKNDTEKVTKTLNDSTRVSANGKITKNDYNVGDAIPFKVSANIPEGIADKTDAGNNVYTKFELYDVHDTALTATITDGKIPGATLYVLGTDGSKTEVADYSITDIASDKLASLSDGDTDGKTGFTLSVDPAVIPTLTPGAELVFEYSMTLNATNGAFKNTVDVIPGNDTDIIHDPTPPSVEVQTGGRKFIKKDASTKDVLAGAAFAVKDKDGRYLQYRKGETVVGTFTGAPTDYDNVKWISKEDADVALTAAAQEAGKDVSQLTEQEKATAVHATLITSSEDGTFEVNGLADLGTDKDYELVEVTAPKDYVLSDEAVQFDVAFKNEADSNTDENTYDLKALDVTNVPKGILPHTGGKGIIAFIIIGAALIVLTAVYFIKGRKQVEA